VQSRNYTGTQFHSPKRRCWKTGLDGCHSRPWLCLVCGRTLANACGISILAVAIPGLLFRGPARNAFAQNKARATGTCDIVVKVLLGAYCTYKVLVEVPCWLPVAVHVGSLVGSCTEYNWGMTSALWFGKVTSCRPDSVVDSGPNSGAEHGPNDGRFRRYCHPVAGDNSASVTPVSKKLYPY
jgi:hypothetical protein